MGATTITNPPSTSNTFDSGIIVNGGAVFNEPGADVDFRIESDTNPNAFFLDGGTSRVGINTGTPDSSLHVVGNFQIGDAETETKGYRFRTSGASLDLDFHSAALLVSGFDGPGGYTGTQREKLLLKVGEDTSALCGDWEIVRNPFDAAHHFIGSGALHGNFIVNEDGQATDFRVESDTRTHMLFVEGTGATENVALLAAAEPAWNGMDVGIFIADNAAAPTADPVGGGYLYVAAGALTWRGSGGTITAIGPA